MDPKTYKHSVKIVKRDGRLGKYSIYLQCFYYFNEWRGYSGFVFCFFYTISKYF